MTMRRISYAALGGLMIVTLQIQASGAPLRQAPAAQSAARPERTVWYFYRVKWGYQDEFVALFQKNHYPVLKST
jgi:hypothetical protein